VAKWEREPYDGVHDVVTGGSGRVRSEFRSISEIGMRFIDVLVICLSC